VHLSVASDDPVSKLLEVRQQGAAVWATLDAQSVPLFRDIFNRMEGHGKSVLEIGSGYGFTSILFALLGAKAVHGMDVVAPAIERAKRIKEQLDPRLPVFFYRCDAAKPFPFQHDVFDIVLAIEVLSHIVTDDLTGLLGEVVRVLRPGGLVYLSDGNNARSWRKRHENYRIWRRFELGPPTQAAETVYTHRIAKPYVEIRRDIAKEAEPSFCRPVVQAAVAHVLGVKRVRSDCQEEVLVGRRGPRMGWAACSAAWTLRLRSHLAPDHPVSSSLNVSPTREDAWDRCEIVPGFWA